MTKCLRLACLGTIVIASACSSDNNPNGTDNNPSNGTGGGAGVSSSGAAGNAGATSGGAAGNAGVSSSGAGGSPLGGAINTSGGNTGTGATGQGGSNAGIGGSSPSNGGSPGSGGTNATGGRQNAGGAGLAEGGSTAGGNSNPSGGSSVGGGFAGAQNPPAGPVELVDAAHVRLLENSPFYDRQELHRTGHLASFDPDRLLYEYRKLAGLPQAGGASSGYPGWDTGFIKGHMAGHYMSAASRMAAATGDTSFKTKVDYMVTELAKCQDALGGGYLAAFPSTVLDWVEGKGADNGGIVVPYYTIHKILAGLLDAYHYVGNQQALEVASNLADYVKGRLAALSSNQIETMLRTDGSGNPQNEFGAMSDVLSELSVDTGDQSYLETAKIFNRSWFMDPLAQGQDNLEGLHANTHIAEALGIAHTANLTGDSTSLQASENFWELVTDKHSFVIGGNSFHEWLDKPGVEAGPSIDGNQVLPPTTAETCNSHNMLKLTNYLFERNPSLGYVAYYERTLYNHILATVAPDTGEMTYFTPMYGQFRTYMNGTYCCSGTGIENTPRYNEGIYFKKDNWLWVNLYIPSQMTWDETGLTLRQQGYAAAGEPVTITITGGAAEATLNLRIPFWVTGAPQLTVNGTAVAETPNASSYVALSRQWTSGDVITLTLPASLRLERAEDVTSMVSVFYGPVLLAGELGSDNMPNDFADKDAYLNTAPVTVPAISSSSTDPADWLDPVDGATLTFTSHDVGSASGITFRPLYDVHHERYSVYWQLQSP